MKIALSKIACTLLFFTNTLIKAGPTKTAQSFMYTRPIYQNVGATQFLWRQMIANERDSWGASFRATPMYQKTISRCEDASYFLMHCQNTISVVGDAAASDVVRHRDVRAEWVGLPSDFQGTLTLHPEQTQAGALLSYNHSLGAIFDWSIFKYSWIDISLPIINVTNHLNPEQRIINAGTQTIPGAPTDIIQALNQESFRFGRISPCKHSVTAVAQLQITAGSTWVNNDDFLLSYYAAVFIPTAKKADQRYMFSPVVGPNGHIGMIGGVGFELPLAPEGVDYQMQLFFNAENTYLFHNHQWRTLDLRGKQWSRYIMVRLPDETTTVPGVNVLTQRVSVRPYSFFNLATGFAFNSCHTSLEVGYSLWTHVSERIKFTRPGCEKELPNIEHFGLAGSQAGTSANASTISEQGPDDTVFVTLKQNELLPLSGSGRGALTQSLHAAFGYVCDCAFIGFGGFFEQPTNNTALKQWGIWGTVGVTI